MFRETKRRGLWKDAQVPVLSSPDGEHRMGEGEGEVRLVTGGPRGEEGKKSGMCSPPSPHLGYSTGGKRGEVSVSFPSAVLVEVGCGG